MEITNQLITAVNLTLSTVWGVKNTKPLIQVNAFGVADFVRL